MRSLLLLFLIFSCVLSVNSQTDSCSSKRAIDQFISFNTTSLNCQSVWSSENFILRYKEATPGLWSFVLSAPDSNSWVAIGFSNNGGMRGTSAIVGWPTANGEGVLKQYYLNGYSRTSVIPDQGNLAIVNPTLAPQFSRLYLAFQLKTATPLSSLIYAVGPMDAIPDSGSFLDQHRSYISTTLDFSTGHTSPATNGGSGVFDDGDNSDGGSQGSGSGSRGRGSGSQEPSNSFRKPDSRSRSSVFSGGSSVLIMERTHGIINIMTWTIILPIGIIAARHYKHFEPSWFYYHIALQMVGFGLVIGGILTGMNLENQFDAEIHQHKVLGFVALGLACSQVTALLVRPDKKSKFRWYWNWYHHWIGRAALVIGVINTFYGINLARESKSWYEYLGIVLGILGLSSIVLEVKIWTKK